MPYSEEGYLDSPQTSRATVPHAFDSSTGSLPPARTTPKVYKTDWNEEFQKMIRSYRALIEINEKNTPNLMETMGSDAYLESFRKILSGVRTLYSEFKEAATEIGRIIISEEELRDEQRSIPTTPVGGVAGGSKYLHSGIFFKFAASPNTSSSSTPSRNNSLTPQMVTNININPQSSILSSISMNLSPQKVPTKNKATVNTLYDSHTAASKAAIHEFRGACAATSALLNSGLHFPLIAVVRYAGRCLIASAQLPLSQEDTLVYGSSDAGVNVYKSNCKVANCVKEMAISLNLDHRRMRLKNGKTARIWGACDIEAHIGTDKKFYIIDTARLFPCEAVQITLGNKEFNVDSAKLTRLLRPELVAANHVPLCPDALTGLMDISDAEDPKRKQRLNNAVIDTTYRLVHHVVPQLATHLDRVAPFLKGVSVGELGEWVVRESHKRGVNLRFLGLVSSHCKQLDTKKLILTMMISRVIKVEIREALRMISTLEVDHVRMLKKVVANFLNSSLFFSPEKKTSYWSEMREKLHAKYYVAVKNPLDLIPNDFSLDLETRRSVFELFRRQLSQEISLTDEAEDKLMAGVALKESDVINFHVNVKTLNIMNVEEAKYYLHVAYHQQDSEEVARNFSHAYSLLEEYLATKPDDQRALFNQIQMLLKAAQIIRNKSPLTPLENSTRMSGADTDSPRDSNLIFYISKHANVNSTGTGGGTPLDSSLSNLDHVVYAPTKVISPLFLSPTEMLQLAFAKCQEVIGGKGSTCKNENILVVAGYVLMELAKYQTPGETRTLIEEEADNYLKMASRINPAIKRHIEPSPNDISWDGLTSEEERDDIESSSDSPTEKMEDTHSSYPVPKTKISKFKFPEQLKPLSPSNRNELFFQPLKKRGLERGQFPVPEHRVRSVQVLDSFAPDDLNNSNMDDTELEMDYEPEEPESGRRNFDSHQDRLLRAALRGLDGIERQIYPSRADSEYSDREARHHTHTHSRSRGRSRSDSKDFFARPHHHHHHHGSSKSSKHHSKKSNSVELEKDKRKGRTERRGSLKDKDQNIENLQNEARREKERARKIHHERKGSKTKPVNIEKNVDVFEDSEDELADKLSSTFLGTKLIKSREFRSEESLGAKVNQMQTTSNSDESFTVPPIWEGPREHIRSRRARAQKVAEKKRQKKIAAKERELKRELRGSDKIRTPSRKSSVVEDEDSDYSPTQPSTSKSSSKKSLGHRQSYSEGFGQLPVTERTEWTRSNRSKSNQDSLSRAMNGAGLRDKNPGSESDEDEEIVYQLSTKDRKKGSKSSLRKSLPVAVSIKRQAQNNRYLMDNDIVDDEFYGKPSPSTSIEKSSPLPMRIELSDAKVTTKSNNKKCIIM